MSAFFDSYVARVLLAIPASRPRFATATRRPRWFAPSLFDSYQPELHYMRGPGPKWRAKRARSAEG